MSKRESPHTTPKQERYYLSSEVAFAHFVASSTYLDPYSVVSSVGVYPELHTNRDRIADVLTSVRSIPRRDIRSALKTLDDPKLPAILTILQNGWAFSVAQTELIRVLARQCDMSQRTFERMLRDLRLIYGAYIALHGSTHRGLYAGYAGVVPAEEMPREFLRLLGDEAPARHVADTTDLIINPYKYVACSEAEPRLEVAFKTRKTMVLGDGNLLMKFFGRPIALCLNTFTTENGVTFVAGNWYSPLGETRKEIKADYDRGIQRRVALGAKWVLVRSAGHHSIDVNELRKNAEIYAAAVPSEPLSEEEAKRRSETDYLERMED